MRDYISLPEPPKSIEEVTDAWRTAIYRQADETPEYNAEDIADAASVQMGTGEIAPELVEQVLASR